MNNVRFRIICFLFIVLCTSVSAQVAQDSLLINLDSAWEMMENNNRELQRLLIDQEILIRESGNKKYWIPGISAGASLSRNSPLISSFTNPRYAELSEADNWSMRGSIDMRLNIDFNISLVDQKEALELNILMLQRESRIRDLKVSLQKLYYQIITGYNTIELHEQSLTLAQNRLEQIEAQYMQGLRSDLELLAAKIAAAKDFPAFERARVDQKKRLITFKEYLGIDQDSTFTLAPEMPVSFSFDGIGLQLLNNDNLQIAELQIALAEINRELAAKNLYTPSLNLNLGWSTSINPLFDPISWTADDWNDGVGLGLSFSVPLGSHINGTGGRLNLQELDDNLLKMKLSLDENRDNIQKQFQFLILDLELNRSNVELSELNVKLQEQNYKKLQENFDTGRASLLELNDSRQSLRAAKLSLENEKLNQLLIQIDLERLH